LSTPTDYWQTHARNPVWELLAVRPTPATLWEQESGQMVVDKGRAWKAINLCVTLQTGLYYSLLNGDKDTFRFAWLAAGVPFEMNPFWPAAIGVHRAAAAHQGEGPGESPGEGPGEGSGPHGGTGAQRGTAAGGASGGFCSHSMGQHDFEGGLLFVHHNQIKLHGGFAPLPPGMNFAAVQEADANVKLRLKMSTRARQHGKEARARAPDAGIRGRPSGLPLPAAAATPTGVPGSVASAAAAATRVVPLPEIVLSKSRITCLTMQAAAPGSGLLTEPAAAPDPTLTRWEHALFKVIAEVRPYFVVAKAGAGAPTFQNGTTAAAGKDAPSAVNATVRPATATGWNASAPLSTSRNSTWNSKGGGAANSTAHPGGAAAADLCGGQRSGDRPSKRQCRSHPRSQRCLWASTLAFPHGQCVGNGLAATQRHEGTANSTNAPSASSTSGANTTATTNTAAAAAPHAGVLTFAPTAAASALTGTKARGNPDAGGSGQGSFEQGSAHALERSSAMQGNHGPADRRNLGGAGGGASVPRSNSPAVLAAAAAVVVGLALVAVGAHVAGGRRRRRGLGLPYTGDTHVADGQGPVGLRNAHARASVV